MAESFMMQFKLETPIVLSDWMTLDAILAAILYNETRDYHRAHNEIPLEKTNGVYHGSAGFLENFSSARQVSYPTGWVKGMDLVRGDISDQHIMPRKKGERKYEKGRGPFKNISNQFYFTEINAVRFCGYGDLDKIQELIGEHGETPHGVFGLGKKRNQGFGIVRQVLYQRISEDRSLVSENGMPMRPLPTTHPETRFIISEPEPPVDVTGAAPPNYKPENQVLCYLPASMFWGYNQPCNSTIGTPGAVATSDTVVSGQSMLFELGSLLHRKYAPIEDPNLSRKQVCDVCGADDMQNYKTSKYSSLCERCYSFARLYPFVKKNGGVYRSSIGDFSGFLVSASDTVAYGPFVANDFFRVEQMSPMLRLAYLALYPPSPPWLYLEGASDVKDMVSNLVVNYSQDVFTVSGPRKRKINAFQIRRAVEAYYSSDVPINTISKYMSDLFALEREYPDRTDKIEKLKKRIEKYRHNYPSIENVTGEFPLWGSEEYSITVAYLRSVSV